MMRNGQINIGVGGRFIVMIVFYLVIYGEDFIQFILWNVDIRIFYFKMQYIVFIVVYVYGNLVLLGEFDGVIDEVLQDLL